MQQQQLDVVPGDQYRYALAQFVSVSLPGAIFYVTLTSHIEFMMYQWMSLVIVVLPAATVTYDAPG